MVKNSRQYYMQVMLKGLKYLIEQFWIQVAISKISKFVRETFIAKQKDGLIDLHYAHALFSVLWNKKIKKAAESSWPSKNCWFVLFKWSYFSSTSKVVFPRGQNIHKRCSRTGQQHSNFGPIGDHFHLSFMLQNVLGFHISYHCTCPKALFIFFHR